MEKHPIKVRQAILTMGAITGWFALAFQFYLLIVNRLTSVPEAIIRFFSYFTILSNILVALCFSVLLLKSKSGWSKFFSAPKSLTAVTVYIAIVGIVYNTILRFTWNPRGLQLVVDELLHSVIPVLFVLHWLIFVPKAELKWKNVFPWLIYPLVYIVYILFRGKLSGFYPYPFIDLNALGYDKVFLNSIVLCMALLLLSLLLVAIAKIIGRTRS